MARVDNEIIFSQMNWRYACKKFDPSKIIREADWNILAESLRLTPSCYNVQPWRFIVAQSPEIRERLFQAAYKQPAVKDASHFVVLAYKEKVTEADIDLHIAQMAKIRRSDISTFAGYRRATVRDLCEGPLSKTVDHWAQRQCYIAMGTFLTTAALMEIDTLPMEGINPTEFDRILDLEGTGYKSVAAIAAGYRNPEDKYAETKKVRFDANDVIVYK